MDGLCVECWGVKDPARVPPGLWVRKTDPIPSAGDVAYTVVKYAVIVLVVIGLLAIAYGAFAGGPHRAHICKGGLCF